MVNTKDLEIERFENLPTIMMFSSNESFLKITERIVTVSRHPKETLSRHPAQKVYDCSNLAYIAKMSQPRSKRLSFG